LCSRKILPSNYLKREGYFPFVSLDKVNEEGVTFFNAKKWDGSIKEGENS